MTSDHLMPTYARLPVTFSRGEGAYLWDEEGKQYLDALCGVAVCGLGHAHPDITAALCEQAAKLVHTSNIYRIAHQEALGDRLCELAGMEQVFFCNSGAEANEAAIKLARLYGHQRGVNEPAIVVMEGSFHGRTLATLSATGNRKVQAGFEPLVQGFIRAPYGDLAVLENIAKSNRAIVAVLVEPVQGEGGVNVPGLDYLTGIRRLCDEHGWLMMLDEVQTGVARTGRWFGFQHSDVQPDVIALAKGLGNGVPIGACLARAQAANVFKPGNHGSTFGGNPLATAAALAVLSTIERDGLVERASELGNRMLAGFREELGDVSGVTDIRGRGLMLGLELDRPCGDLVAQALAKGLLINVTVERVVRLLPPFILSNEQADFIVTEVSTLIRDFLAQD